MFRRRACLVGSARVAKTRGSHFEGRRVGEGSCLYYLADEDDRVTGGRFRLDTTNDVAKTVRERRIAAGGVDHRQVKFRELVTGSGFRPSEVPSQPFLVRV